MRKVRRRDAWRVVGSLVLLAVLAGCGEPEAVVIADGQLGPPSADVSEWAASPAVVQAIAAARSHWSAQQPGYPEEVRVWAVADGAFTRPGAEQHAVLYAMSRIPRGFPMKGLALVEDGRLVRNFAFTGLASDVWALPDIDGDRRDELAFGGSFGMGGQYTSGVTLLALGDDGLRDQWHASVFDTGCPSYPDYGTSSARITVVPGSPVLIQRFRKASCEATAFEPAGPPAPLVADASGATQYDEIPLAP